MSGGSGRWCVGFEVSGVCNPLKKCLLYINYTRVDHN